MRYFKNVLLAMLRVLAASFEDIILFKYLLATSIKLSGNTYLGRPMWTPLSLQALFLHPVSVLYSLSVSATKESICKTISLINLPIKFVASFLVSSGISITKISASTILVI